MFEALRLSLTEEAPVRALHPITAVCALLLCVEGSTFFGGAVCVGSWILGQESTSLRSSLGGSGVAGIRREAMALLPQVV